MIANGLLQLFITYYKYDISNVVYGDIKLMIVLSLDNIISKLLILVVLIFAVYSFVKSVNSNDAQERRHYEVLVWIAAVLMSVLAVSARLP